MASNLATFKALLVGHIDAGKEAPSVILKEDNDLGQAFSRVVTSEQPQEGETVGQQAGRYLDEICATLGQEENAEANKKFAETADLFTSKIKNAWSTVEGVRETGKTLAADMEKIASEQLTANEFVSKHINYSQLISDFPIFGWDGTKIMGSINDVVRHVNGLMTQGEEVSDQVNRNLFNIIIADMTKFGQIEDVSVTEETRKAAIDALSAICQNTPTGDIENVIDAVTGINKNCPICSRLSQLGNVSVAQTMMFDNITLFDGVITSFFPVLELIVSGQVDPVPTSKETVVENAKKLIVVLELAAYYEYMHRTTTFRESLLLQGGLINSDLNESYKQAGGTAQMLAEFIRFMYADDAKKIPVMGIKSQSIIDGAATVAEKVKKDIANVESRVALARNTARTAAYRIVMRDYIGKKVRRDNPEIEGNLMATKVEEFMKARIVPIVENIRQYNVNFIDAAMNGIVAVEYPNTFVEHLFKELGAAYISATEENGNITAADLRQADVAVIAKLVCTFLVDHLVEVVPDGTDAPVANA